MLGNQDFSWRHKPGPQTTLCRHPHDWLPLRRAVGVGTDACCALHWSQKQRGCAQKPGYHLTPRPSQLPGGNSRDDGVGQQSSFAFLASILLFGMGLGGGQGGQRRNTASKKSAKNCQVLTKGRSYHRSWGTLDAGALASAAFRKIQALPSPVQREESRSLHTKTTRHGGRAALKEPL